MNEKKISKEGQAKNFQSADTWFTVLMLISAAIELFRRSELEDRHTVVPECSNSCGLKDKHIYIWKSILKITTPVE